jgi:putative salt-induced outer membrane protein
MMRRYLILLLAAAGCAGVPALGDDTTPTTGWERGLTLGFNLTDGNSDTTLLNIGLSAQRKGDPNEWLFGARYAYGETENETTADNAEASAQYNRLLSDRLYAFLKASYFQDDLADIDYRVTVAPGLGYYVIKSGATMLAGELGPAYTWEETGDERDDFASLRVAERFEHNFSETAKAWQSVEYLPRFDDFGDYLLNAEVGAQAALNSRFSLQVTLTNKYDSEPAAGRENNDLTLNAGVVAHL